MKKMLKRLGVVIPSTILTLLMAVGFSTPAFAFVDTTEVTEEPTQVIEEAEPTEEEKLPFTIAGNGEVEDDIVDDPSKEFFTVKTKGGNTFFLVIDRARNSENVYMLSMINEYDLQEFLDDEERNGKQEEETPAVVLPETKPEPIPDVEIEEPKEESSGGMNKILLLVFVAALGGAGAFFYFYIYKSLLIKNGAKPRYGICWQIKPMWEIPSTIKVHRDFLLGRTNVTCRKSSGMWQKIHIQPSLQGMILKRCRRF